MPRPRGSSVATALVVLLLKTLWVALVVTTPVLGAWVSSSLAAYSNGTPTAAAATGLVLFPLLPLAWEGFATYRRRRRGVTKPHILTFGDRLVLRTLAVNLVFLGALLGTRPAAAFAALSTRGDWMLDGQAGPRVDGARKFLFRAADRLEWLYLAVHEDRFAKKTDEPAPASSSSASPSPVPPPLPSADPAGTHPTTPAATWPLPPTLHPAVASMPADAERSIESVARYIADRDSTPEGRLKAAHDWVADRIAYDAPAYLAHQIPAQDAATVFARRVAVCAGYADLLAALGKALGVEVLYLSGDARTDGVRETGESHAWNAARLGSRYVLVDATWDSGFIEGTRFKKAYRTEYFETPPDVFSVDHFPREERWQLRATPLSRGDFFRQPMMTPAFYAEHRELVSPTRSQVTVRGPLEVVMRTPAALFTLATFQRTGTEEKHDCVVERGEVTRVRCELPASGAYSVKLFSNTVEFGSYHYVGQVEANREM
jgi:transglutaminase-like putative cysteine protease